MSENIFKHMFLFAAQYSAKKIVNHSKNAESDRFVLASTKNYFPQRLQAKIIFFMVINENYGL